MADRPVKTVHKVSIRADDVARKQIYKPVLASPFEIKWPATPPHARAQILDALIELLTRPRRTQATADEDATPHKLIADYRAQVWAKKRKRRPRTQEELRIRRAELEVRRAAKRERRKHPKAEEESGREQAEARGDAAMTEAAAVPSNETPTAPGPLQGPSHALHLRSGALVEIPDLAPSRPVRPRLPPPTRPQLLDHLTVGINAVTKSLEDFSRSVRSSASPPQPPFRLIFVCRSDIDPVDLVAHIPATVAAANEAASLAPPGAWDGKAFLMQLGEGAELRLADALGLRRVAAIGLDDQIDGVQPLANLISHFIPPPSAPWLATPAPRITNPESVLTAPEPTGSRKLVPTHIKHYKSLVPLDPKGVRKAKVEDAKRRKALRRARAAKKREARPKAERAGKDAPTSKPAKEQDVRAEEAATAPAGGKPRMRKRKARGRFF